MTAADAMAVRRPAAFEDDEIDAASFDQSLVDLRVANRRIVSLSRSVNRIADEVVTLRGELLALRGRAVSGGSRR